MILSLHLLIRGPIINILYMCTKKSIACCPGYHPINPSLWLWWNLSSHAFVYTFIQATTTYIICTNYFHFQYTWCNMVLTHQQAYSMISCPVPECSFTASWKKIVCVWLVIGRDLLVDNKYTLSDSVVLQWSSLSLWGAWKPIKQSGWSLAVHVSNILWKYAKTTVSTSAIISTHQGSHEQTHQRDQL